MQRELKNTGVSAFSVAEVYNRCTHKNLSQVLPNRASPGEESEKGQPYRNNSLEYSVICHTMISSEWSHACLFNTWYLFLSSVCPVATLIPWKLLGRTTFCREVHHLHYELSLLWTCQFHFTLLSTCIGID